MALECAHAAKLTVRVTVPMRECSDHICRLGGWASARARGMVALRTYARILALSAPGPGRRRSPGLTAARPDEPCLPVSRCHASAHWQARPRREYYGAPRPSAINLGARRLEKVALRISMHATRTQMRANTRA